MAVTNNALLVDQVIRSRLLEQSMLESLGIHTVALDSAQDAIQLLETGVHFDFILVDFDLSIINGPEVSTILFKIFSLWHFN